MVNATSEDDLYGELSREECPIEGCEGERVTTQSTSLPLGCSEMTCTGTCGAFRDFQGRRHPGSKMNVKYPDASRRQIEDAHSCPTDGCDERVPSEYGASLTGTGVPDAFPDWGSYATFHTCAECDTEFAVAHADVNDSEQSPVVVE